MIATTLIRGTLFSAALAASAAPGGCDLLALLGIPTETDFSGYYTLETLNGESPPLNVAYVDDDNRLVLLEGSLSIDAGGGYEQSMESSMYISGERTSADEDHEGTYTTDGSSISMVADNGRTASGTLEGDVLTVYDYNGNELVWVR